MRTIVLLDADSLLFQACKVSKEDSEDGKGGDCTSLQDATFKFDEKVQRILNELEETYGFDIIHTVVFLEGEGNYRYSLDKNYKANRKDKPALMPHLKDWVLENYKEPLPLSTFLSYNVESDDSIAATARKFKDNDFDVNVVVAAMDKDLKTIPCNYFDYYWSRFELQVIEPFDAYYNLMIQMLVGDPADNVKGVPRVGDSKAKKMLKGITTTYGLNKAVYKAYLNAYGSKGREEYIKALYTLRLNDGNIKTPNLEPIMF